LPVFVACAALEQYRALHRTHGLIVDGVEDEFVATTMGLPRVQYALPSDPRTMAGLIDSAE
jgi:hypothetical protein